MITFLTKPSYYNKDKINKKMDNVFNEIFEDESFIKWVQGEKIDKWETFLKENPEKVEEIMKMKEIINILIETKEQKILNEQEKEKLWQYIEFSINNIK